MLQLAAACRGYIPYHGATAKSRRGPQNLPTHGRLQRLAKRLLQSGVKLHVNGRLQQQVTAHQRDYARLPTREASYNAYLQHVARPLQLPEGMHVHTPFVGRRREYEGVLRRMFLLQHIHWHVPYH